MKKLLSSILVTVLILSLAFSLYACGCSRDDDKKRDTEEREGIVRYDLCDVDFPGVTLDVFKYNYIIFDFDNGTYVLENMTKSPEAYVKQTGSFEIDSDGNISFTNDSIPSQNYVLYIGEDAYFKRNKLYIEAQIPGFGEVSMTFKESLSSAPEGGQASKLNGDRYDLVSVDFPGVSIGSYVYNYIIFNFDKGTYRLENKAAANNIVMSQTGKFTVSSSGKVSFTNDSNPSNNFILYAGENAYFLGGRLYVEASVPGYGSISMVFEKSE